MNWLRLSTGWLNLDAIVSVEIRPTCLSISTGFRAIELTTAADILAIRERLEDMSSRWLLADPAGADVAGR